MHAEQMPHIYTGNVELKEHGITFTATVTDHHWSSILEMLQFDPHGFSINYPVNKKSIILPHGKPLGN